MLKLEAGIGAARIKTGSDLATLELDMPIIVVRDTHLHLFDQAAENVARTQVVSRLIQIDAHRLVLVARLALRNAVEAAIATGRQADEAVVANKGDAERTAVGRARRIRGAALRRLDVIGIAAKAIEVISDPLATEIEPQGAGARAERTVGIQCERAAKWHLGRGFGDAKVDDIDESARCAAAIQQSGRTADDLHGARENAVDTDSVIFAERGGIERIQRVGQHTHALAELAANHGTRGDRAEVTRTYAQFVGQRLADTGSLLSRQGIATQNRGRLGQFLDGALERRCRDDDLLELMMFVRGFVSCRRDRRD